ncbi:MAG: nitrogen regulation protein NR(II) [Porticoccaceae bacterium]
MNTESELFSQLLNYLNTAIVLVDSSCEIRYMNQSAEAIFGLSMTKALGMDIVPILSTSNADRHALVNAIQQSHPFIKRKAEFHNALGKNTIVDYSVTPFDQDDGNYLLIEISEMDRLIRISREESILATHDTSRQLIRGLAHEVKNPLGGIRGAAQLLASELDNPEWLEYTDVIAKETDRLRNLVDRMLGPNVPPNMAELNIHEVLERVSKLLEAEDNQSIRIVRDYDPSLPEITGDFEQLIQAVLNIARNAKQAISECETKNPHIILRTRIQHRFTIGSIQHLLIARIDIEDNGPGISNDKIDDIFYPMITSRSEGTGLGLPIAQSIINAHSGLVECQSQTGQTIFSIFLPISQPTESNDGTTNV